MRALVPTVGASDGVRLFPLLGDGWEPKLRSGDMLLVAPIDHYDGGGGYLLSAGPHGESAYMVERCIGLPVYYVWHPNEHYPKHTMPLADFKAAVVAKVIAEVRVCDRTFLSRRIAA